MAISIVQELKTDLILHAKIRRRPNVELFDEPNSNLSQRPPPVSNRDHFLDLTVNDSELFLTSCTWPLSLSIRPSYGARGEEILDGGGRRRRRERKFLSFTSLPFSLPFFPFSPLSCQSRNNGERSRGSTKWSVRYSSKLRSVRSL